MAVYIIKNKSYYDFTDYQKDMIIALYLGTITQDIFNQFIDEAMNILLATAEV